MLATPPQPQKMTVSEYPAWEPRQDIRYEYVNGEGRMWLYYPYTDGDIITLSSIEF